MELERRADYIALEVHNNASTDNQSNDMTKMQEQLERLHRENAELRIESDGRNPREVFCPKCKVSVVTEVERKMNEGVGCELACRYCIGGIGVIAAGLFLGAAIGAVIGIVWGVLMCGVWIVLCVVLIVFSYKNCVVPESEDVTHSCPMCKEKLGVSDGQKNWRAYEVEQHRLVH